MGIRNMTPEAAYGWAGGILDGEGHIGAHLEGGYYVPVITVTNADPRILVSLTEIFGLYSSFQLELKNPKWQRSYVWRVTGSKRVFDVLQKIRPYLVIKGEEADLLMQLCQTTRGDAVKKEKLANELKLIKKNRAEVGVRAINDEQKIG